MVEAIKDLRRLRNQIVYPKTQVNTDIANKYVKFALRVAEYLDGIANDSGSIQQ
jgi:hypothetical protein